MAAQLVAQRFASPTLRFPGFYLMHFDYTPEVCTGAVAKTALQVRFDRVCMKTLHITSEYNMTHITSEYNMTHITSEYNMTHIISGLPTTPFALRQVLASVTFLIFPSVFFLFFVFRSFTKYSFVGIRTPTLRVTVLGFDI